MTTYLQYTEDEYGNVWSAQNIRVEPHHGDKFLYRVGYFYRYMKSDNSWSYYLPMSGKLRSVLPGIGIWNTNN